MGLSKGIDDALANGAEITVHAVRPDAVGIQGWIAEAYESASAVTGTVPVWNDMEPIPNTKPTAPSLPADMLPEALRTWLVDAAERLGIPLEFVAVPALVALATVVGRKIAIHPKRYDDWAVVPVLWGLVIARPGRKKTAALNAGLKPLAHLEERANAEYKSKSAAERARKEVIKAKRCSLQDKLKKAVGAAVPKDLDIGAIQADLEQLERDEEDSQIFRRRYRTNDATIERLAVLLGENPNGMTLERDELVGFLRSFEKAGREPDRAFYLECWNGTGRFQVDRISREATIDGLCLSIIAGSQPGKFEDYILAAMKGTGDDGLVQRIQLAVYPDFQTPLPDVDRKPDKEAWQRALEVFIKMDGCAPEAVGAAVAPDGKLPTLRFSDQGQQVFNEWSAALNSRLGAGDMELIFEAHLSKYQSLMPTLALLFHLVDWASGSGQGGAVSEGAARLAADWCAFLEEHAKKVYAVATHPGEKAAEALAQKIRRGKVQDGMSVRDVYRFKWSMLSSRELVMAAVAVLEACNWLKIEEAASGTGRRAELIRLHPSLRPSLNEGRTA